MPVQNEEVHYVGHTLSKKGLEADPDLFRTAQDMDISQHEKEGHTCLNFITYL
ncbi:hypothetical protein DPMN_020842 [Dreissena polymorpha]|uniref:Uncharacterized protein n=1 Tax=Dreissena polymorpha TaxID=45954 RepID=A0A9D4NMU9_DREPO|nr:hypothetical protein DPMN_020842 [Dreissena polymorpha]